MNPFTVKGRTWVVVRPNHGDPRLVDGTGRERLGTADYWTRRVAILGTLVPPLLDRVMLHEAAHAVMLEASHGATESPVADFDEISAQAVENYAIEALRAATEALGRPPCIDGSCLA